MFGFRSFGKAPCVEDLAMRVACFVEGLLLSWVGYLEVLFHTFYNHCTEEDRSQNKNLHYCKFLMWKRQCMIKI